MHLLTEKQLKQLNDEFATMEFFEGRYINLMEKSALTPISAEMSPYEAAERLTINCMNLTFQEIIQSAIEHPNDQNAQEALFECLESLESLCMAITNNPVYRKDILTGLQAGLPQLDKTVPGFQAWLDSTRHLDVNRKKPLEEVKMAMQTNIHLSKPAPAAIMEKIQTHLDTAAEIKEIINTAYKGKKTWESADIFDEKKYQHYLKHPDEVNSGQLRLQVASSRYQYALIAAKKEINAHQEKSQQLPGLLKEVNEAYKTFKELTSGKVKGTSLFRSKESQSAYEKIDKLLDKVVPFEIAPGVKLKP